MMTVLAPGGNQLWRPCGDENEMAPEIWRPVRSSGVVPVLVRRMNSKSSGRKPAAVSWGLVGGGR